MGVESDASSNICGVKLLVTLFRGGATVATSVEKLSALENTSEEIGEVAIMDIPSSVVLLERFPRTEAAIVELSMGGDAALLFGCTKEKRGMRKSDCMYCKLRD